jgi:hypothetical protein
MRLARCLAAAIAATCLVGTLRASPAMAQQPAAEVAASADTAASARAPLPRDLPLKRDVPGQADGPPWTALVILLALTAGAGVVVLRRRGARGLLQAWQGPSAGAGVERLASQSLTAHASVHAVRWQGEEFLLACTSTQVTVLSRRPTEPGPRS